MGRQSLSELLQRFLINQLFIRPVNKKKQLISSLLHKILEPSLYPHIYLTITTIPISIRKQIYMKIRAFINVSIICPKYINFPTISFSFYHEPLRIEREKRLEYGKDVFIFFDIRTVFILNTKRIFGDDGT